MKNISKIVAGNPVGIGLLIAHWIIALTALFSLQADKFDTISSSGKFAFTTLILLCIFDLPAIIIPAILFCPALIFGNFYFVLLAIGAFFTISYQWLFLGKKFYGIFRKADLEIEKLGILK